MLPVSSDLTHLDLSTLIPSQRARRRRRLDGEQDILDQWEQDVCSGDNIPEVEIISLLEEQIPRYKLRADTLTSFTGYENQDWYIPSPALKQEEDITPLTPEQIRETLNYFLLCSNRVSQMTQTYNDIEAVTRLLEEKEKDLELSARIGKELLAHNNKLESTVNALEAELKTANEKITQLTHDLTKKTQLIQILTNDVDDSSSEGGTPTAGKPGSFAHLGTFETLQRRIASLENENTSLRGEATRLAMETEDCENIEAQLVTDLVSKVESMKHELSAASTEIERSWSREQELKDKVDYLQNKLQASDEQREKALKDNQAYITMINISRETQDELAKELAELKDKYTEVMNLLEELQENARKTKKKSTPTVRAGPLFPYLQTPSYVTNPNSIRTEIESSLLSELSLDSGISGGSSSAMGSSTGSNFKKVFDTVRAASSSTSGSGVLTAGESPLPPLPEDTLQYPLKCTLSDSPVLHNDLEDSLPPALTAGRRTPNTDELEDALKNLNPATVESKRARLAGSSTQYPSSFLDPYDCATPDSFISGGSGSSYAPWKLLDRLQIVKPLEGSLTLHQWNELATPSLGGLLDDRGGVKIQGGTELEALGLQLFSLSDVEEDEVHPGKSFQESSHIYTYTNSTVLHPDDNTMLSSSYGKGGICSTTSATSSRVSSRIGSTSSSRMSSVSQTPLTHSRRNSTSMTCMSPGLAQLLSQRGIKARTPSALGSPEATPTATPPPSPSRGNSPTPDDDDQQSSYLALPGFLVSSGAELLRRTIATALSPVAPRPNEEVKTRKAPQRALVRPDNKAGLTPIRLVETIERIGLEELLGVQEGGDGPAGEAVEGTLHQAGLRRRLAEGGDAPLGAPGVPGRAGLVARLGGPREASRRANRQVRPDLGSVPVPSSAPPGSSPGPGPGPSPSPLGTLSSVFLGRKGGLI